LREPVERLQARLNHEFDDLNLLDTALTHRSAGMRNNERFEFLGDSILGFVIADYLYEKFPAADEGQLSRLRASLVKREALADIAKNLELGQYLKLGQGELRSGGHRRDSILADAVEAVIAAIYLDTNYQRAKQFIFELYESQLTKVSMSKSAKDPKTRLQELLQSRRIDLPDYEVIESSGPQHKQTFVVNCKARSIGLEAIGTGSSKRKAEQDAAMKLLEIYEQQT